MKPRNKIWTISSEELIEVVKSSTSLSDILKFFGLSTASANYVSLKTRLKRDNIDFSHIKLGINSNKNRNMFWLKDLITPLSEILIAESTYSRYHLKERLLKEGLLLNKCYVCGLLPQWNGKTLSLQLDHINGIGNDNRIENLRMLCPNCHSQTPNFGGKNVKKN